MSRTTLHTPSCFRYQLGPMLRYIHYESPVGCLLIALNNEGLKHIIFPEGCRSRKADEDWQKITYVPGGDGLPSSEFDAVVTQLDEYFAGKRRTFDLDLAPEGTDFQRAVWQKLTTIKYANTCSYGDIAKSLGKPTASRAVGAANGANPLSIIIPCHRVIGAGGSLTGFGGGLPTKQWLLAHERGEGQLFAFDDML